LFRQYIGAGINLVVPAFWSLWLSSHFGFPVISAFRPFQLSGHSGNFLVVLVPVNKRNKQGDARRTPRGAFCRRNYQLILQE
jgi:hypothetical protein